MTATPDRALQRTPGFAIQFPFALSPIPESAIDPPFPQDYSARMKVRGPILFIAAVIALVVVAYLIRQAIPRKLTVTARVVGGRTEFGFSLRRINGLLDLRIWRADTRETLWQVNLNYFKEPWLAYGEVRPLFFSFNGAPQRTKQTYPADGTSPDPLPPNGRLFMSILIQYDDFLDAMTSSRYFLLTTDAAGHVVSISELTGVSPGDYPIIKETVGLPRGAKRTLTHHQPRRRTPGFAVRFPFALPPIPANPPAMVSLPPDPIPARRRSE